MRLIGSKHKERPKIEHSLKKGNGRLRKKLTTLALLAPLMLGACENTIDLGTLWFCPEDVSAEVCKASIDGPDATPETRRLKEKDQTGETGTKDVQSESDSLEKDTTSD